MDVLFNLFKIRFVKMDELLNNNNEITPDSKINIFINLEPIIRLFVSKTTEEYLRVRNNERVIETVSNIINLASHYRLYCAKHKLSSRIIMYAPSMQSHHNKNKIFNKKYRDAYNFRVNKDTRYCICQDTIKEAFTFTRTILEYIDDVYLIDSGSIESGMIPMITTEIFNSPTDINFLITTDRYEYQYANKDFYVFRPKKENSYLIRQGQIIDTIKVEEKISSPIRVNDKMFSFVYSILGDKNKSIDKIKGVGTSTILSLIDKAKVANILDDDITNINLLINAIKEDVRQDVLNNFYCIDIDFQNSSLTTKDKFFIECQLKNRFGDGSLIQINNQYFANHPIQIIELLSHRQFGEKPKNNKVKNVFS